MDQQSTRGLHHFPTSVNRLFDGSKEGLECQVSPRVEVQSMNTLLEDLVSRDAILAELACIVSDPGPFFVDNSIQMQQNTSHIPPSKVFRFFSSL